MIAEQPTNPPTDRPTHPPTFRVLQHLLGDDFVAAEKWNGVGVVALEICTDSFLCVQLVVFVQTFVGHRACDG